MPTYKTPDVYIEEISLFPPSVAEVETAIPAFIGYTEKAERDGRSLRNKPTRIKSLLQYVDLFGGAPKPQSIEVGLNDDNTVKKVDIKPQYFLFDSLRLFFANGGGDCYVVSVNTYQEANGKIELGDPAAAAKPGLLVGLQAVEKVDEPTLLLFPDAVLLGNAAALGDLQKAALEQCNKLQDRFGVFDVYDGTKPRTYDDADVITIFRNSIGIKYLKYGAAYYPWVETNLNFNFSYSDVKLYKGADLATGVAVNLADISKDPTHVIQLDHAIADHKTISDFIDPIRKDYAAIAQTDDKAEMEARAQFLHDLLKQGTGFLGVALKNTEIKKAFEKLTKVDAATNPEPLIKKYANTLIGYDKGYPDPDGALGKVDPAEYPADYEMADVPEDDIYGAGTAAEQASRGRVKFLALFESIMRTLEGFLDDAKEVLKAAEDTVKDTNPVYQAVLEAINKEALTLPPSGAIAGVYASVDNSRGVWKAPANISLNNVVAPAVLLTNSDQEDLNVDTVAGKSINAIRAFTGKGIMVWGARTLAGNDNEWRYISVRRFFNMVEESVKKATYPFVFEPNDANTWIKVKSMIENYLIQKWRDGALAGAKPDEAFFVKIGLGVTMSPIDILEGRMNVEIGMAVVRPAEFIILKFSHKMQQS